MPSVSLRRLLVVLSLAALLCLPSAALAAGANRHVQAEPGVFARIWGFLQGLWGEEGMSAPGATRQLTHLSGAEGMTIDPNGSHTSTTSGTNQPSSDAGMMIDPNGSH